MKIDKSNIDQYIKGTGLYCYARGITSIEDIPDYIIDINCDGNQLTNLPKLPDGLISLDCECNNLTSLPMLPDSLEYLYCVGNNLTSYPVNEFDKQWWTNHNNQLKLANRSTIINKVYDHK